MIAEPVNQDLERILTRCNLNFPLLNSEKCSCIPHGIPQKVARINGLGLVLD